MNHPKYIPQGPFGHWHELPYESGLTPGFSGVPLPPIPPKDTPDRSVAATKALHHEWPRYPTEPTGDPNVPFYPGPKNAKILDQIHKTQYLCDQAVQDFTQAWEASHPWPIRNRIEARLLLEDFRRYIHPFVKIMAEYASLISPSYLRSRADTPGNPPPK